MGRARGVLSGLLLVAVSLMSGPGMAVVEAWEHSHRNGPWHGREVHVEARDVVDHGDLCSVWIITASSRPAGRAHDVPAMPVVVTDSPVCSLDAVFVDAPRRLPPSRGPPPALL
ncbi:MAG: hypothetical protein R2909_21310 [Gemmatimonadales bacterium]